MRDVQSRQCLAIETALVEAQRQGYDPCQNTFASHGLFAEYESYHLGRSLREKRIYLSLVRAPDFFMCRRCSCVCCLDLQDMECLRDSSTS